MDKLVLNQNNITEQVDYTVVESIKDKATPPPVSSNITGNITTNYAYADTVTYLKTNYPNLIINITDGKYIRFADLEVQKICATNWGDGNNITIEQAILVKSLNKKFKSATNITTFTELVKFSNVTSLNNVEFMDCISLKSIDLSNITKIDNQVFKGCTNLESVELKNCTYIGGECFLNCTSLKSLGDTSKIEYLGGSNVFGNCSSLAIDLNFPNLKDSNTNGADCSNSGITNIISLGSITVLSASMHSCKNLKTVILPETLQDITNSTFYDCSNLLWVKILSTTMCKLTKTDAFDRANNCILYVVDTLVDTYKSDTNWSKYASRIKALSSFT